MLAAYTHHGKNATNALLAAKTHHGKNAANHPIGFTMLAAYTHHGKNATTAWLAANTPGSLRTRTSLEAGYATSNT